MKSAYVGIYGSRRKLLDSHSSSRNCGHMMTWIPVFFQISKFSNLDSKTMKA